MDRVLYKDEWYSIKEHNSYPYVHEEKCNGTLVSILPFRKINGKIEFLMRYEVIPSHSDNHEFCGVIGGYDDCSITIKQTAVKELKEETGYSIDEKQLIELDWVYAGKSNDTKVYLFSCDLTNITKGIATTDGTELEKNAYCRWEEQNNLWTTNDPNVYAILAKLTNGGLQGEI